MIEKYSKEHELDFLDYVDRFGSKELYLTENNIRIPIKNKGQLKKLVKSSSLVLVKKEKGDIQGVIIKWSSNSDNSKREYIKLSAVTPKDAVDLLTMVMWHTKTDLYIKVDNNSTLKPSLEEKGFRFFAGRGEQILMKRQLLYVSNNRDIRNKDEKSTSRFQSNRSRPIHIRQQ